MKKVFRQALAIILAAVTALSLCSPAFGIEYKPTFDKKSSCGEDCGFFPTIIVPGLGQSSVCVTDDNGDFLLDKDGNKVSAFPAYLQLGKIIGKVLFPALATLVTQRDIGFSDAFADAIDMAFGINTSDENAQNTGNVVTEKYMYPYSEFSPYEVETVNHHVPFERYATKLPKDHLYYFAYNSFGNHIDLATELYEFIQMVKKQTGHDKVNLVPLSQGASIVSAMLEYFPQVGDELHKVIFVVPAIGGSIIIGDVFNGRINFLNKDYLYNGFLEEMGLLDEYTARLIEVAVRILPDEVVMGALNKGVKALVENTMIRSTGMWALCPPEDYPTAAEKYLSSPDMAKIKEQTDRYYQAQLHAHDNIQALVDKGVMVFDLAEYNIPVINVAERWNTMNGDFIIHLSSTSLGAYSANVGETLPDGYTQKNTHCSDPSHNHISPERVVDASAGLLPDTTFYFNGNRHDLTQYNDVILKIAMKMIADDEIKDVYSSDEFPQFLPGRNVSGILELTDAAKALDKSKLKDSDRQALEKALADTQATLDNNLSTNDDLAKSEDALRAVLVKIGAAEEKEAEKDPSFLRKISLYFYENYGTNGYSEIPALAIKGLFAKIKDLFA